jgi:hypothetical protein
LNFNTVQAKYYPYNLVSNYQDTVPPINKIAESNIDTVITTYKTKTLVVKLKNGNSYSYDISKWQYDDTQQLNKKISGPAQTLRITFSKAETPPLFPGGEAGWVNYIEKFRSENKEALKDLGSGNISVQFIVDNEGGINEVKSFTNTDSKLAPFAEEAVKNSPPWIPATQHGHKVVCYQKVVVKFN